MRGIQRHRSRRGGRIGVVVLLLAILLPILSAQSVGAAAITVDSLGDGTAVAANCMVGHVVGTCRLRDALAAAGSGGTITFAVNGTINVNQAPGALTLALNVTIQGPGATMLKIDGGCATCGAGGTATGGVTVFQVNSGVTNATISGLTIQHGNASVLASVVGHLRLIGGGIANLGTLTVTDSVVTANSADNGGGIANFGTLMVTRDTISNNASIGGISFGGSGGGIYNNDSVTLQMTSSTVSGNTAASSGIGGGLENRGAATIVSSTFSSDSGYRGGGIEQDAGTLTLMNSVFSGNMATGADGANTGGAIDEGIGSTITVTNSVFVNNTAAGGGGGGIEQGEGALTLTNVTFAGNTSNGGGGIEMSGTSALIVTNSTFSGNAGGTFGGGGILRDNDGAVTVTNSTFSANSGTTGGALFNDNSGPLTLKNTIIAGNTGGNCATALGGTISDGGHNLQFGDASCGATIPVQNSQLGALMDNGGTSATTLPDGSHAATLAITNSSPAFNHGDPAICTAPLPPIGMGAGSMDERGFPRGNGAAGNVTCSMGAFELYVGLPNPLPNPQPTAPPRGVPNPLPTPRPTVVPNGISPAPLPSRRP
ncbi:MAG: right-handed parallel beta-helix repeat-containing protein [Thermomicrobiales bacterium]